MREITVCKAGATGDREVEPVVLKIIDDAAAAMELIPMDDAWERNTADHYDAQAALVLDALYHLPGATIHRVLIGLLEGRSCLLRVQLHPDRTAKS
jgi:hypothetical protein